jgi:hypothetical protein
MSNGVITCVLTVTLSLLAINIVSATKVPPAPIQITFSSSRQVICVYNVRAAPADRVKVQLLGYGKNVGTVTKVWEGGIDNLLAVTERASTEAKRRAQTKPEKGDRWGKVTIRYSKGGVRHSFSIEGELDELFRFFWNTVDLKALLTLVSSDAPKAYRLIFVEGNPGGTMRAPIK